MPRGDSRAGTTGDQEERETPPLPRVRWTMLLPIVLLLAGSLAVGAVPAVARAVSGAAVGFLDRDGYVAQALRGTPAGPRPSLPEAAWTASGVALGLLSALLAVGLAAAALWGPRLPVLLRRAARGSRPVLDGLRRVHSGRVGDYVAWLFVGVAALTALVGLPLV